LTREVFREAGRNLASGTSRMLVLALVAGSVMAGLTAADGVGMVRIIQADRDFRLRAATTWIVKAQGQVDPAACEALRRLAGVPAAGARRPASQGLTVAQLPQNPITVYQVTPGFLALLPDLARTGGAGLVVSDQVAGALGWRLGDRIASADGQAGLAGQAGHAEVAGTYAYPDDGRAPGLGWAALEPVNARTAFDECWVDIAPDSPAVRALASTAIRLGQDQAASPEISQLNSTLGPPADQAKAFHARPTLSAPWLGAATAAVIAATAAWARRLELAAARHARVPRLASMIQFALEAGAWLALAGLACLPIVAHYAVEAGPGDGPAVAWALARVPLAVLAAGVLVAFLVAGLIREKRLFAYFKAR
jgi:hypothetical protein